MSDEFGLQPGELLAQVHPHRFRVDEALALRPKPLHLHLKVLSSFPGVRLRRRGLSEKVQAGEHRLEDIAPGFQGKGGPGAGRVVKVERTGGRVLLFFQRQDVGDEGQRPVFLPGGPAFPAR